MTGAGLILLTLVLRLTVIFVDGDRLHSDPDAYVRLATQLADGQGYSTPDGTLPTAFRPVLYPLLLAALLWTGMSAPVAVAVWNLLAGVVLVWAIIQLARECGLNQSAAWLAGALAAADPLLLRYTTEPMTEAVSAALLTVALCWLLRLVGGQPGQPNLRTGIVAGVLLGLNCLCRPVVLVACVLLTATLLLLSRSTDARRGESPSSNGLRRMLLLTVPALVAAATVMPWVIRNAIQFQALIPATTHGGYTLLLGNNSVFYDRVVSGDQAAWDGESLTQWQRSLEQQQEEQAINRADERAVDQWMYRQAIAEMRQRPGDVVQACVLRWRRFWALTPTAAAKTLPQVVISVVGVWYAVLGLGVLVSLLQLHKNHHVLLLWMSVASFLAVHSFYWTNTRMRAPLTGVLIILAVAGWAWLTGRGASAAPEAAAPGSATP